MKKGHNIIFSLIAVVIAAGVGFWYYTYWEGNTYLKTENAKVYADLYTVTPTGSGKLVKLNVAVGSMVNENEVIGRIENGPYIKSPVRGQVVKCDVTLNQMVAPTVPIAVIAQNSEAHIRVNIEETEIMKIKDGQEVTLTLDAFPGKTFEAHVAEIDKVTQTALSGNLTSFSTSGTYTKVTQLIPVKILLDDPVDLTGVIGTNAFVKIKVR